MAQKLMRTMNIPFNKPYVTGKEIEYMSEALISGKLSGNYFFSQKVKRLIWEKYGLEEVFLTPSCTAALEMGALLAEIKPGDEVIMPSYTFTSTANSVLIFGGKPIFCEINPRDMNIDVTEIEKHISPNTKMIIPIDYAGVPCDIDAIMDIANKHNLLVMHDCAQSYGSLYCNEITGKKAHLSCYSFHDTKNYTCGEGGALIVNKTSLRERASFIMEKGTDRTKVIKGIKDRYSWIDKGSSYLLADMLAAMLLAQLEHEEIIKNKRINILQKYIEWFAKLPNKEHLQVCNYGEDKSPNAHGFWMLMPNRAIRDSFLKTMEEKGISAYIGYIPLHSSKMGLKLGYKLEDLRLTEELAGRIVRMPIYAEMDDSELEYVQHCAGIEIAELIKYNDGKAF